MIVKKFVVGYLSTNCYLVYKENSGKAIIIDPPKGFATIKHFCDENSLKITAVLLTHGHFDHITEAHLWQDLGAKIVINILDLPKLTSNVLNLGDSIGMQTPNIVADIVIEGDAKLCFAELDILALHTPGHSKGGMCYIIEDFIFSGDTMFKRSFGRVDFYDGDIVEMKNSIRRLVNLTGDYTIYPGHEEWTTLAEERTQNSSLLHGKNIRIVANLEDYLNDVSEIIRSFSPYLIVNAEAKDSLVMDYRYHAGNFELTLSLFGMTQRYSFLIEMTDDKEYKKETKKFFKNKLYLFISNIIDIKLPYGSLTGVRPTKLYYELMGTQKVPTRSLIKEYFVSTTKAQLIEDVVKNQVGYYKPSSKDYGLFINIPFCESRCKYCSFISTEIARVKNKIPFYIDKMIEELNMYYDYIKNLDINIKSIYVGGGTPTVLSAEELDRLLSNLSGNNIEFTVEAGRPDSLTAEKLAVLKKNGVTRISVNPQTANDETLRLMGRNHTFEDTKRIYTMAKEYGFDINMDIICGLEGEGLSDLKQTMQSIIALNPDNITIHTLSLKRGSKLTEEGSSKNCDGIVSNMVNFAYKILKENDYLPYYMYRQKNMADNLENVGFSKKGKFCIYNIDIMEEATGIIGIGAGAMSKTVEVVNNRIERQANPKDINLYLERPLVNKISK